MVDLHIHRSIIGKKYNNPILLLSLLRVEAALVAQDIGHPTLDKLLEILRQIARKTQKGKS